MIGVRQGKNWGYTTKIFESQYAEIYDIEINKGGYCSEHRHKKINIFYVISGKLKIKIWQHKKIIDETVLEAGQISAVYAGFWHQFEALEDTRCIEVYHTFLDPSDIERRTEGGMKF